MIQLLLAASVAATTLVSPQLTGPLPVGTFDVHLTGTQADPWHPEQRRELMISVSFPAHRRGAPAPWLGPGLASAVGPVLESPAYLDVPAGTVDWTGTKRRALANAPALPGKWPVVLFSPGMQGPRELYANLVDDLASRGYVVVSLSHTYESAAVEFPGNRIVWGEVNDGEPAKMKKAIDARVSDARFVLSELPKLVKHADFSRVGMFGHSYGGYTAGETMVHDRRFDAGINIDGAMEHTGDGDTYSPGEIVKRGVDRPFLLFGGDLGDRELSHVDTSLTRSWADFWPNQRGWKRDLHMDDGAHHGFSDLQWTIPQIPQVSPERRAMFIGSIKPEHSLKAQHDYVGAFFDLHLKKRHTTLFDRVRHQGVRFVE